MKVGILTFHFVANHGAYLQAFNLVKTIRELGHQVEIINYQNAVHHDALRFRPWVYRRPLRLWFDFRKNRALKRAYGQLPLSRLAAYPAQVDWNAYDTIVIGSDIVWNYESPDTGRDQVFFGRFPVPYRGRLVAYAPSIGPTKWNAPAPPMVAEGLRQFHAIGVRDIETQKFVQNLIGREVPLVADPTWLNEEPEASSRSSPSRTPGDFMLVYCLPLKWATAEKIRSFARKHSLRVVGVGYYQGWADRNWGQLNPFEWVELFHRARYVVCATFHGTLYSIRERAQFCTLTHPGVNSKVITPLTVTGQQERLISSAESIEKILEKPIDYDLVEQKRIAYARQSLAFLKQALS